MKKFVYIRNSKYKDYYLTQYFYDHQSQVEKWMDKVVACLSVVTLVPLTVSQDTGKTDKYGDTIFKLVSSGLSKVNQKFIGLYQDTPDNQKTLEKALAWLEEESKCRDLKELESEDMLHLKALYLTAISLITSIEKGKTYTRNGAKSFPQKLYNYNHTRLTKLYNKDVGKPLTTQADNVIVEREREELGKNIVQDLLKEL